MRKVVFVLAVAMIIGIVGVVTYDRNDAPQPRLVNAPLHVFSHGIVRVCAQDKRNDGYETKITASAGSLSKPSRLYRYANTALNEDGKKVIFVSNTNVCSEYRAPSVEKKTTLLLRASQNGKVTDEAKVTLMPDMPF